MTSGACAVDTRKDYFAVTVDSSAPPVCQILIEIAGIKIQSYGQLGRIMHPATNQQLILGMLLVRLEGRTKILNGTIIGLLLVG